jgi:hypothetical protein
MKHETGNWTQFRKLPLCIEVDFHRSEYGPRKVPYEEAMADVRQDALDAILRAYAMGLRYVLLTHGSSTSRPGQTTARSEIRALMRGTEVSRYVVKKECVQHQSCFVVAIRENTSAQLPKIVCPQCNSTECREKSWAGYFRCKKCQREFKWFDLDVAKTEPAGSQDNS